jgi:hypothetical protein
MLNAKEAALIRDQSIEARESDMSDLPMILIGIKDKAEQGQSFANLNYRLSRATLKALEDLGYKLTPYGETVSIWW